MALPVTVDRTRTAARATASLVVGVRTPVRPADADEAQARQGRQAIRH